ncbi:hypothetical protein [Sunxiuqinia sp. sy24]|uniref:hypothetical protein n=1 Tax=Sunxiuqinia sp. sy24 TaxID=3461495 RepID=UPI004045F573
MENPVKTYKVIQNVFALFEIEYGRLVSDLWFNIKFPCPEVKLELVDDMDIDELLGWGSTLMEEERIIRFMKTDISQNEFMKKQKKTFTAVIKQLSALPTERVIGFFQKQWIYYHEYHPSNRAAILFETCKNIICMGPIETIPDNFTLTYLEKQLYKLFMETYCHFYEELNKSLRQYYSDLIALKSIPEAMTSPELSLKQIALIYAYKNKAITIENANSIAGMHGFKAENSGKKLRQAYNLLRRPSERTGDAGSKLKNRNKIKLLESVKPHLSPNEREQVDHELVFLKNLCQ